MQQKSMFPNSGLYLQVQDMSNIKAFSANRKPDPAKRAASCSSSSKQLFIPTRSLTIAGEDLLNFADGRKFGTILADPPWQFQIRTGKVAPEHKRLARYGTLTLDGIKALPVPEVAASTSHLYLWVPNALLPDGLSVMRAWGFQYKSNLVWHKIRKDGGSDGRGVGFYFRNVTELILFGVKGKNARTLDRKSVV